MAFIISQNTGHLVTLKLVKTWSPGDWVIVLLSQSQGSLHPVKK